VYTKGKGVYKRAFRKISHQGAFMLDKPKKNTGGAGKNIYKEAVLKSLRRHRHLCLAKPIQGYSFYDTVYSICFHEK
jgi:hypothetical protein